MRLEQPSVATVAAGEREGVEQAGHAMVEDGAIVAAGLVAERAGEPTFADARSKQRHNAGCPAFEVRIFYPFHPRAGQMVQVEHRKRFAGEEHLVVVQPDGTLALIPAWMSEETARSTAITGTPCLSIDRLVELRVRLDALLASSDGESAPREGGDHATTTEPAGRPVRGRSKDVGHSEHRRSLCLSA